MRRQGGWLALLAALGLGSLQHCVQPPSAPEEGLTVATWNLRWFPAGQPEPQPAEVERKNVQAAARTIRTAEPQVLCLQEIRDARTATALAEASGLGGFRVAVCTDFPQPDGTPGQQQTAILTCLPVLEAAAERWHTAGMVDPPRGYAYALLDTPGGQVAVYSIHLKSNYLPKDADPQEQTVLNRLKRELAAEQLRAAIARLDAREGQPPVRIVIAGDFNTALNETRWEDESTLRGFLAEGYVSCFEGIPPEQTHTLPGNAYYPAVTFDYILHRGFAAQRCPRIHPKHWVSDHRLVSVRLQHGRPAVPAAAP